MNWVLKEEQRVLVFRYLSISALVKSGCVKKEKEEKGLSLLEIT